MAADAPTSPLPQTPEEDDGGRAAVHAAIASLSVAEATHLLRSCRTKYLFQELSEWAVLPVLPAWNSPEAAAVVDHADSLGRDLEHDQVVAIMKGTIRRSLFEVLRTDLFHALRILYPGLESSIDVCTFSCLACEGQFMVEIECLPPRIVVTDAFTCRVLLALEAATAQENVTAAGGVYSEWVSRHMHAAMQECEAEDRRRMSNNEEEVDKSPAVASSCCRSNNKKKKKSKKKSKKEEKEKEEATAAMASAELICHVITSVASAQHMQRHNTTTTWHESADCIKLDFPADAIYGIVARNAEAMAFLQVAFGLHVFPGKGEEAGHLLVEWPVQDEVRAILVECAKVATRSEYLQIASGPPLDEGVVIILRKLGLETSKGGMRISWGANPSPGSGSEEAAEEEEVANEDDDESIQLLGLFFETTAKSLRDQRETLAQEFTRVYSEGDCYENPGKMSMRLVEAGGLEQCTHLHYHTHLPKSDTSFRSRFTCSLAQSLLLGDYTVTMQHQPTACILTTPPTAVPLVRVWPDLIPPTILDDAVRALDLSVEVREDSGHVYVRRRQQTAAL